MQTFDVSNMGEAALKTMPKGRNIVGWVAKKREAAGLKIHDFFAGTSLKKKIEQFESVTAEKLSGVIQRVNRVKTQ